MRPLTFSEKQWVLSFLLVDLVFWFFVLWNCAFRPEDCLEAASLGTAFFYAPFYFLLPDFGSVGGYAASLVTGPLFGFLCHAFIGFATGRFVFRKPVPKWVSIGVALLTIAVIVVVSFQLAILTGFISY
jgi:hypothetical protein